MSMRDRLADPITLLWILWLIYWWVMARRLKPVVRQETVRSRLAHLLPLAIAAALLIMPRPGGWLGQTVVPWQGHGQYLAGLVLVALGLGFSAWARALLGRNWSGTVTVKTGHELIVAGPYRLVRHPIYTGLLLAFLGTAVAQDQWRALLALLLVWLSFWRKWRLEEHFMQDTFGDRYRAYRAKVPAVVPWKWPR